MTNDIDTYYTQSEILNPTSGFTSNSLLKSYLEYRELYDLSINAPEIFWAEQAEKNVDWFKKWDKTIKYNFNDIGTSEDPYVSFFSGGKLNISHNCLDRHLKSIPDKPAIIWQGEKESETRTITYAQLHKQVCSFAGGLKSLGINRGDAVTIYMPMIPEAVVAMLACSRIGAIHSVVFSAFSTESLKSRINDCGSKLIITADVSYYSGKIIPLAENVGKISDQCSTVKNVVIYNRSGSMQLPPGSNCIDWQDLVSDPPAASACEQMDSEDPLFILYTSGSTGKPKGVLHTTGGYLVYANLTFKYIFDHKETDVFWCTADIGWITGHSYLVYGPLSNGATCVMYEGTPTYPNVTRFWEIIDRHKVTIFYTAPTAIRALMKFGEEPLEKFSLTSLRLLGTVGEPINPEAWNWYYKNIGKSSCPVVDTWWQTETGGIMITTLPGAMPMKPGSAGVPFFGVSPAIVNDQGKEIYENETGNLIIDHPWPGMLRGVYGDKSNSLIAKTYFSKIPGKYFTGDSCSKDPDGYYWLKGRIDDVLNVSAHRLSTAELESALVEHPSVAEAAVVGFPHDTKGQGIHCFVTLKLTAACSDDLSTELCRHIRQTISPIAVPDRIQFAPSLPKTRSGKIMRRILRKIAEGSTEDLGDISTLAEPDVVKSLVEEGKKFLQI